MINQKLNFKVTKYPMFEGLHFNYIIVICIITIIIFNEWVFERKSFILFNSVGYCYLIISYCKLFGLKMNYSFKVKFMNLIKYNCLLNTKTKKVIHKLYLANKFLMLKTLSVFILIHN